MGGHLNRMASFFFCFRLRFGALIRIILEKAT